MAKIKIKEAIQIGERPVGEGVEVYERISPQISDS